MMIVDDDAVALGSKGAREKAGSKELISRDDRAARFVTFIIGQGMYAIEAVHVQEIVKMTDITHVPNGPRFMKGIINLRGFIVPVIDLRMKFGLEEKEYTGFTVIIIVEVKGSLSGMIVDAVSDVIAIREESINEATTHYRAEIDMNYIKGVGKVDDDLIIIMDAESIMKEKQLTGLPV